MVLRVLISSKVTGRVLVASGKTVVVVMSGILVVAGGLVLVASRVARRVLIVLGVVLGVAERVLA